jgi:hypothetical protein
LYRYACVDSSPSRNSPRSDAVQLALDSALSLPLAATRSLVPYGCARPNGARCNHEAPGGLVEKAHRSSVCANSLPEHETNYLRPNRPTGSAPPGYCSLVTRLLGQLVPSGRVISPAGRSDPSRASTRLDATCWGGGSLTRILNEMPIITARGANPRSQRPEMAPSWPIAAYGGRISGMISGCSAPVPTVPVGRHRPGILRQAVEHGTDRKIPAAVHGRAGPPQPPRHLGASQTPRERHEHVRDVGLVPAHEVGVDTAPHAADDEEPHGPPGLQLRRAGIEVTERPPTRDQAARARALRFLISSVNHALAHPRAE